MSGTDGKKDVTISVTIQADTYALLKIMADGNNLTIGQCIDKVMEDIK